MIDQKGLASGASRLVVFLLRHHHCLAHKAAVMPCISVRLKVSDHRLPEGPFSERAARLLYSAKYVDD